MFVSPFAQACRRLTLIVSATLLLTSLPAQDTARTEVPAWEPLSDHPVEAMAEPEVTAVISGDPENPNEAGLGEEITVKITNVDALIHEAKANGARILLYVNGLPLKDVISEPGKDYIRFLLNHDGDVIDLWDYLMESRRKGEFFHKNVAITVGVEGKDPVPTLVTGEPGKAFTVVLVRRTWLYMCLLMLAVLLSLFVTIARKTDMLRDTGPSPATGRKPYSLARVQMGIWFLVILSSWLLLYVCLHRFNIISESLLILMGITAGTGIGGAALDSNKAQTTPAQSQGFFRDIVSDHSNVSLFRFQNFAWTVVLVVVFVRSVMMYMKMPEFDTTLLLLMGISSGTYIGAKVTEKREEPAAAAPAAETGSAG
jgi:hypothetical protein